MNYGSLYENKKRGTFDFPIELYRVDSASPRYQMPFHWHLEYELILVKSGIFELSLDGSVFAMNSGDCAWIGTGVLHGGTPEECIYECVVFDLASRLLSAMRQEQKGYEWTTLGLMWQLMGKGSFVSKAFCPTSGTTTRIPCLLRSLRLSLRCHPNTFAGPFPR